MSCPKTDVFPTSRVLQGLVVGVMAGVCVLAGVCPGTPSRLATNRPKTGNVYLVEELRRTTRFEVLSYATIVHPLRHPREDADFRLHHVVSQRKICSGLQNRVYSPCYTALGNSIFRNHIHMQPCKGLAWNR